MAALAAIAAQLIGVDKLFHLYVVPELERHGDVNQLLLEPRWKERCLHPTEEDYTLVEVPVFKLSVEQDHVRLLLDGKPDGFVHEVVRAKPTILAELPEDVVRDYWAYVIDEHGHPPQYEELTIRIGTRPASDADFPVTAYGEGVEDVTSEFIPLFDTKEIKAALEAVGSSWTKNDQQEAAKALGRKLFDGLFTGSLLKALWQAESRADTLGHRLRLRLRLADEARLDDFPLREIPWELLHDNEKFLGLSQKMSIVRHLETEQPAGITPIKKGEELRVLIAAASPAGWSDLSQAEALELRQLYTGVQKLALRLGVDDVEEPPRTFEGMKRRMKEKCPFHVLYFTGHGEPGELVFEKHDRGADVRPVEQVAALLTDQDVRLVVLNACYGAQSVTSHTVSIAEGLVEAGLPAVVAMQSTIVTGKLVSHPAIRFAQSFFFHLALGWPIDACVTEARIEIQAAIQGVQPGSFQWASPVCFMRSGDGILFTFDNN
jgi:hypothetical protein